MSANLTRKGSNNYYVATADADRFTRETEIVNVIEFDRPLHFTS